MLARRTVLATLAATPLLARTARAAERRVTVAIVGQSNEQGVGSTPGRSEPPGYPLADPIPPLGGRRSLWPDLSTLLGRVGVSFAVWNSAVGATGLAENWVGRVRAWRRAMPVAPGSLVLSDGALWLCTASPRVVDRSAEAPAGGEDVTTGDGVRWRRLGVPPATHVDGYVVREGETGFDPNGFLARAWDGLARAEGGRERWAFVSIGQGDKTFGVERGQYAAALVSTSEFFLKRGARVALGFTSRVASPGGDAWYDAELVPGWRDALARYPGDARVAAGANLYEALGKLPVQPPQGPGLQADGVHMNDAAYTLASQAWFDALRKAGW